MHSLGKEDFLVANLSRRRVIGDMAIEEGAVPEALAVAVARLLGKHFGNLLSYAIDPGYEGVAEYCRRQRRRKRSGGIRARIERRNSRGGA